MRLKFFKPPTPKYNKERLYKIALKEAISQLVLEGNYNTYASAYSSIMNKAKKEYQKTK